MASLSAAMCLDRHLHTLRQTAPSPPPWSSHAGALPLDAIRLDRHLHIVYQTTSSLPLVLTRRRAAPHRQRPPAEPRKPRLTTRGPILTLTVGSVVHKERKVVRNSFYLFQLGLPVSEREGQRDESEQTLILGVNVINGFELGAQCNWGKINSL